MRFVSVKSAEQQSQLMLHRTRDLLMRQRTQVINALRAHMAELGITAAQGNAGLRELLAIIAGAADERLPAEAHAASNDFTANKVLPGPCEQIGFRCRAAVSFNLWLEDRHCRIAASHTRCPRTRYVPGIQSG
jgi:hypothetical protein